MSIYVELERLGVKLGTGFIVFKGHVVSINYVSSYMKELETTELSVGQKLSIEFAAGYFSGGLANFLVEKIVMKKGLPCSVGVREFYSLKDYYHEYCQQHEDYENCLEGEFRFEDKTICAADFVLNEANWS